MTIGLGLFFFAWALVLAGGFYWIYHRNTPDNPPYRNVVRREDTDEGEHCELECGHHVLIRRHRRNDFPCDQCKEDGKT